jgi:Cdc6-like AAA superfamily ATPase
MSLTPRFLLRGRSDNKKKNANKPPDEAPVIAILGSTDSGKTTLARYIQEKFSYQFSAPDNIINSPPGVVFATILETMQKIIKACEANEILFETQESDDCAKRIMKASRNLDTIKTVYTEDLFEDIVHIYSLVQVQELLNARYENGLYVPDGGLMLLQRLKKNRPDTQPSFSDFLCASQPTLDIHLETENRVKFGIADCSGILLDEIY